MKERLSCIFYCFEIIFALMNTESTTYDKPSTTRSPRIPYCNQTQLPNEKFYQDCSAKGWFDFPVLGSREITTNTEILNISSNPISVIRSNFDYLENLKELIMSNLSGPIYSNCLTNLKKLEILDISFTKIYDIYGPMEFPNTTFRLFANKLEPWRTSTSQIIQLELAHLNLTDLAVASNSLNSFPNLDKMCPIVSIDLSENPLENFTYYDLAPFCTLETLTLDNTIFSKSEACCGVKTWTEENAISSTLTCEAKCDSDLDQAAIDANYQCEIRTGRIKSNPFSLYFEVFVGASLILATCYLVFRYYNSHAVKFEKKLATEEAVEEEEEEEVIQIKAVTERS